jgi:drug/metabolite transporter (DMT)-like permease
MGKLLVVLFTALIFEAIGVVFLSKGLKQIGAAKSITVQEVGRLIGRGVTNRHILLGVFFEAIFFVGLLMLMSKSDVTFVWPLTSLSFVMTTFAAKFFLHEHVSSTRWAGVCLIMAGAALITWSEKTRSKPAVEPIQASSSSRVLF